ncbi:MAG: arginine--tRNA ligase [Gammaproteobacteria bacterium]|nr:arginine--tRNA ligase [Gammaproteobacteria bacterium]
MSNIRETLEVKISTALSSVAELPDSKANVIIASRSEFGDYQANGIMSVAKQLKSNPRELAQQVVEQLGHDPLIDHYEVAGPGFINIHLSNSWLEQRSKELQNSIQSLIPQVAEPQTIVVDYSSPNLAKEMHVGHLRGTIIGDSLVRVLEALGHKVIRQNHVGDWGTQFGMLIAYLQSLSTDHDIQSTQLADLEVFYRAAKARFDTDPDFAATARACVVKLQAGDTQILAIWEQFIEESLHHCGAIYEKLNIKIQPSDLRAESFYNNRLQGIIDDLNDKNLVTVSDGAKCVFLDQFKGKDGNPLPVIVQKSDGGFLYATTDLAAIQFRGVELGAERVLYVVDARQSLHFQQIFAVAHEAGFVKETCKLEHIAYGTMMGKDGRPFKTRSGDTIKLVDLLDEASRRAFVLVSDKNPDLDNALRQKIAETVGIGAVKYADLSKNRTSDYIFDWDSMLSFEGNTAPYLLYAYARIKSILRKQEDTSVSSSNIIITDNAERALIIKLLQLPEVLQSVAKDYLPSHLSTYLYELAGIFMRFYEACPILKAEPPIKHSRLLLAEITANTLKEGLHLLGLETLEQM